MTWGLCFWRLAFTMKEEHTHTCISQDLIRRNWIYCKSCWRSGLLGGGGCAGYEWPKEMAFFPQGCSGDGISAGQRSTRSCCTWFGGLFKLRYFVWENCVLSIVFTLSKMLATEFHEPCLGNKQWVWGQAVCPETPCLGFCSSYLYSLSWLFPFSWLKGQMFVCRHDPFQGTSWFWAWQCVIKRKIGLPWEPIPFTNSWHSLLTFSALFYFSWKGTKPRKAEGHWESYSFIGLLFGSAPVCYSLLHNGLPW